MNVNQLIFTSIIILTVSINVALAVSSGKLWPDKDEAPWVGVTLGKIPLTCNGGNQRYGPYDYSKRHSYPVYNLNIVVRAHFTPKVENLREGDRGPLEQDLNYTLRAWPNHHRALLSISRFAIGLKNGLRYGRYPDKTKLDTPPECYFQRAINFSPEDSTTYSLFGYYLKNMGYLKKSEKAYKAALSLSPDNIKIKYDYALLLVKLKKYDQALKLAKEIYPNKKAPKGLMNTLKKINKWN